MHSSRRRWSRPCSVVALCLLSSAVLAQSTGGRILGKVSDPSGAVLAGVKVTLVNEATAAARDVQTNDSGDYVFVAGQMPNNEAMTGIEPAAYRAPNAIWNGTDIRLQTEFLITSRLKPALEAGGSSLKNAIKAQVYLTKIEDLPEFMDVWNSHFRDHPCALTVVNDIHVLGVPRSVCNVAPVTVVLPPEPTTCAWITRGDKPRCTTLMPVSEPSTSLPSLEARSFTQAAPSRLVASTRGRLLANTSTPSSAGAWLATV